MNHSTMEMESHVVDIMMIRILFYIEETSLFYYFTSSAPRVVNAYLRNFLPFCI